MPTPSSGADPYCTVDELFSRYDRRAVAQLMSNTNRKVTEESLQTSAELADLLGEASGMVESAATVGNAYRIDAAVNELEELTGNSRKLLAGLVAHIAFFLVWNRRPNPNPGDKLPAACDNAMRWLEQLRKGERVLGLVAQKEAGQMADHVITAGEVESRGGLVVVAERLFGRRTGRLRR